ncbi:MAG: hypothetical protein CMI79_05425 [Candidatus Pelagibacter sp.]|nr:hypothetical protein [Candidatus Pelagibacter sp.]
MLQNLQKIMHTKLGQILISIILGFGLASIFRRTCKETDCFSFYAPKPSKVEKNIYTHGGNCYSFKTETLPCSTKNPIGFA